MIGAVHSDPVDRGSVEDSFCERRCARKIGLLFISGERVLVVSVCLISSKYAKTQSYIIIENAGNIIDLCALEGIVAHFFQGISVDPSEDIAVIEGPLSYCRYAVRKVDCLKIRAAVEGALGNGLELITPE